MYSDLKSLPAAVQKHSENKKKHVFLTESKKQHLNLKQAEIIPCMKGTVPSSTHCSLH